LVIFHICSLYFFCFRPQTREPYSVVHFLAERVDLPKILKLNSRDKPWTTFDICEAWAEKRGYVTARSNRLDVSRAANHIMRMALEGRICLCLRPPEYDANNFSSHPDLKTINDLLALDQVTCDTDELIEVNNSSDEDSNDSDGNEEMVGKLDDNLQATNKFSLLEEAAE